MNPEVTVIVPVHDGARYLPECIASLRAQTLASMEFLFVDDGSRDGTPALLSAAAREDARVRVITFPENRGVSAARNAGIGAARGEFIGFCDADDTAEPEMYGALLSACRETGADVSFCRVYKDRANGSEDVPLGFPDGTVFGRAAIRAALIPRMLALPKETGELPLSGYSPRNLFRRETIGSIRYREDIRYAEDLLFIVTCLLSADAAVAVDRAYYHYRFHGGSTTKRYSPHIPESFDKSNGALETLLPWETCRSRMLLRRRKMAADAARNFCADGTPYSFPARVREIRRYAAREDVRGWFSGVRLSALPPRIAVRYGLMKYRLALPMAALYSTVFRVRA